MKKDHEVRKSLLMQDYDVGREMQDYDLGREREREE